MATKCRIVISNDKRRQFFPFLFPFSFSFNFFLLQNKFYLFSVRNNSTEFKRSVMYSVKYHNDKYCNVSYHFQLFLQRGNICIHICTFGSTRSVLRALSSAIECVNFHFYVDTWVYLSNGRDEYVALCYTMSWKVFAKFIENLCYS